MRRLISKPKRATRRFSRTLASSAVLICVVAVLVATALSGAGASGGAGGATVASNAWHARTLAAGVTPASAGCAVHLLGGATPAQNYDVCISGKGNVNGFSWGDASVMGPFNHMDNEGYCVARDPNGSPVSYYDAGPWGDAGFGFTTTSMASPRTFQVIRTTNDGLLTVTQNFFLKPGTSQLFIGVIVKNNDSVSHQVLVERYFHPVLFGDPFLNWTSQGFSTRADSGDAGDDIELAFVSRNVSFTPTFFGSSGGRLATPTWKGGAFASCGTTSLSTAASPGDNYGGQAAESSPAGIAPGGSVTFQFAYRLT